MPLVLAPFPPGSPIFLLARKPWPDKGEHVLAHPLRRAILRVVTHQPGVTLGELLRLVPMGWGNAYHHLGMLERAGLVKRVRVGRRVVVVSQAATMDEMEARARAYLHGSTAAAVCRDVFLHPGTSVVDVASRTGHTVRTVYYHVRLATSVGLLVSRSPTRQFALHALPLYARIAGADQ
ncbi:MAG: Helix-turn-helix domain [Thermoplasmata archaeon]|nr:Helix-turn-helix domain [Thermoplasmata archaeon]